MHYLVFGAAGSIGSQIVAFLKSHGHSVVACSRERNGGGPWDVCNRADLTNFANASQEQGKFDGIIYAIGHCPPNGFSEAIKYPLSELPLSEFHKEINMHQVGVLNVFQVMLECLIDGGCFVFLSSAITRLKGQFPPFLQAYHYASAISAEDWLIDGMRADPEVERRGIKIHRLAPAAVDTPFHHGGPKPPKLIPISTVVDEVISALRSTETVDKQIL